MIKFSQWNEEEVQPFQDSPQLSILLSSSAS